MLYPKVLRELATKVAEVGASREGRRGRRLLVLAPSTCPGSTWNIQLTSLTITTTTITTIIARLTATITTILPK